MAVHVFGVALKVYNVGKVMKCLYFLGSTSLKNALLVEFFVANLERLN